MKLGRKIKGTKKRYSRSCHNSSRLRQHRVDTGFQSKKMLHLWRDGSHLQDMQKKTCHMIGRSEALLRMPFMASSEGRTLVLQPASLWPYIRGFTDGWSRLADGFVNYRINFGASFTPVHHPMEEADYIRWYHLFAIRAVQFHHFIFW